MEIMLRAEPGPFGEVVRMTVNGVRTGAPLTDNSWYAHRPPEASLLRTVREMTYALEVSDKTSGEWTHAITTSLSCLRAVWANGGGVLVGDRRQRTLSFTGPPPGGPTPSAPRQPPPRREPVVDPRRGLPELLLDPRPPRYPPNMRVGGPGVLRHLAEASRDGCRESIWSTPTNPGNHAKRLKARVRNCPHAGESDD